LKERVKERQEVRNDLERLIEEWGEAVLKKVRNRNEKEVLRSVKRR
jgi:hypothetical protein